MSAEDVLGVFGAVLQTVAAEIPIVGPLAGNVFGVLWGKLKTDSPAGVDVTVKMATMIAEVKKYVDDRLNYAKQQICIDAMASFTSLADDLKVQITRLPASAPIVIATHQQCVIKARDALHVLYDLEYAHITLHNYAMMASLYLALLDDGIKDKDHWGIDDSLKETYLDRRARFFKAREFSTLLANGMDKAGQGNVPLRLLTITTTQITNFWYCFDPQIYPLGVPTVLPPLKAGESAHVPDASHVYLQPPGDKGKCVVNNMPGGYVHQVIAKRADSSWRPYYPGYNDSIVWLTAPEDKYPRTVHVRFYRLANVVASKFIGIDYEIKVTFSNDATGFTATVDSAIPGQGSWKGKLLFDTEAVVLSSEHPNSNIFRRGQGEAAKVEYVELGTVTIADPCDVRVAWKPTSSQATSSELVSALELLVL